MAVFLISEKTTVPVDDDWQVKVENLPDVEVLQYLPNKKMKVDAGDEISLRMMVGHCCRIDRA